MTTFNSTVGPIASQSDLFDMGRSDLIKVYNELTGKTTKSFRTRTVGITRTTEAYNRWVECQPKTGEDDGLTEFGKELLEEQIAGEPTEEEEPELEKPETDAPVAAAPKKSRKKPGPRGIKFPLPGRVDRKAPRNNSRVEHVMLAMSGSTSCDYNAVCAYVTEARGVPFTVGMLTGVLRHISTVLGYGVSVSTHDQSLRLTDEEGNVIDHASTPA